MTSPTFSPTCRNSCFEFEKESFVCMCMMWCVCVGGCMHLCDSTAVFLLKHACGDQRASSGSVLIFHPVEYGLLFVTVCVGLTGPQRSMDSVVSTSRLSVGTLGLQKPAPVVSFTRGLSSTSPHSCMSSSFSAEPTSQVLLLFCKPRFLE